MKKKILFIIEDLNIGGAEKSLVNLLNQFDYNKFDVDLFLFKKGGTFNQFLPSNVRILETMDDYKIFSIGFKKSIQSIIRKKKFRLFLNRIIFTIVNNLSKDKSNIDQYNWKYLSKSFNKLEYRYDVAIGYMEKASIYFCVDKVIAEKKIGFIHTHYGKSKMNPKIDKKYFEQLDSIVTVSTECINELKQWFPELDYKFKLIYNIISPTMIKSMSESKKDNLLRKDDKDIVIVSVGRLHKSKGYDLSINACRRLVDKGYNIKWYIIGDGEERNNLENIIKNMKLQDRFKLLGVKSNPYPYVKHADIFAQTSIYEGKSIAIDEAKILNKPIIITNYQSAKDQIKNEKDGIIVDINSIAISEGIERIINDKKLKDTLCKNLSKESLGTEDEINKLYTLF